MMCEQCGKYPATVHITKIVNDEKAELHLCERCARERGELEFMAEPKFSVQDFLAGLFNYGSAIGPQLALSTDNRCKVCGFDFTQFSAVGRLGCGHCYVQFRDRIEPLLRRIHGSSVHTGKTPRRAGVVAPRPIREIEVLRRELEECVRREDFERAAELRDKIRELEKKGKS